MLHLLTAVCSQNLEFTVVLGALSPNQVKLKFEIFGRISHSWQMLGFAISVGNRHGRLQS